MREKISMFYCDKLKVIGWRIKLIPFIGPVVCIVLYWISVNFVMGLGIKAYRPSVTGYLLLFRSVLFGVLY